MKPLSKPQSISGWLRFPTPARVRNHPLVSGGDRQVPAAIPMAPPRQPGRPLQLGELSSGKLGNKTQEVRMDQRLESVGYSL